MPTAESNKESDESSTTQDDTNMSTISITWRLFADLAEIAGTREASIEIAASATVGDALDRLLENKPTLADRVLADTETGLATEINLFQNGSDAKRDNQLIDGDELALFPPVTGG